MRLKLAVPLALLGLVLMFVGIGQRTFWAPEETRTVTLPAGVKAGPVTVIDAGLREVNPERIDVRVRSEDSFTLAVGRAGDVDAWVGDASHLRVEGVDDEELTSSFRDGEPKVPNPKGSDLWQSEETAQGEVVHRWLKPAPGDWSILIATDGTKAAPTDISLTWPNSGSTPLAIPLIVVGALLMVLALALAFLARRDHSGPEAVAAPPPTLPRGSGERPRRRDARSRRRRGRSYAVAALASSVGLMLASLTPAHASPSSTGTSSTGTSSTGTAPTSAETSLAETSLAETSSAETGYPVVLDTQLRRILDAVAGAVQAGDAAKDAKRLEPRVAGAALNLRRANYQVRARNGRSPAPAPVVSAPLLTQLVSAGTDWPRTMVAVTKGDKNPVPQALVLVQDSPRTNYRLTGTAQMLPGTTFPKAAPEGQGTPAVAPDSGAGLLHSPAAAVTGLAEVLTTPRSGFRGRIEPNTFVNQIARFQVDQIKANRNAKITFRHTPAAEQTRALRTGDGGAVVYGYMTSVMTSLPAARGATIRLGRDYAALTGTNSTTKGVEISFGESILLYVPPAGSSEKVQVIGAAQDLVRVRLRK